MQTFSMNPEKIPTGLILTNAHMHGHHVYTDEVVQKYKPDESTFLIEDTKGKLPKEIEAAAMSADPHVSHAITNKDIYMFDDREGDPKKCTGASGYKPIDAIVTRGRATIIADDEGKIRTFTNNTFNRAASNTGNRVHPTLPIGGSSKILSIILPENDNSFNLAVVVATTARAGLSKGNLVVYAAALDVVCTSTADAYMPWCNLKIIERSIEDYIMADLSKIVKFYKFKDNKNYRYLLTCMSYGCMKTFEIIKTQDRKMCNDMKLESVHTIEYVIVPEDDTFLSVRVEETHHLKGDGTPMVLQDMSFLRAPEGPARDAFMNKFKPVGILSTGEHIAGAFAGIADELCHLGESYSNMFPR